MRDVIEVISYEHTYDIYLQTRPPRRIFGIVHPTWIDLLYLTSFLQQHT